MRARTVGYFLAVGVMVLVFAWHVLSRIPLELDVIRDRNQLFISREDGSLENIFSIRLLNMDNAPHQFSLYIEGLDGAQVLGESLHNVDASEVRSINLRISLDPDTLLTPSTEFTFHVQATDDPKLFASSPSTFLKSTLR
ncbi:MAG: polyferredoxin [Halieaceae bacterium]